MSGTHWQAASGQAGAGLQRQPGAQEWIALQRPHLHSAISALDAEAISRGATVCWNNWLLTMS